MTDRERIEQRANEIYRDWQNKRGFSITYELELIAMEERTIANQQLKEKDKEIEAAKTAYSAKARIDDEFKKRQSEEIASLKEALSRIKNHATLPFQVEKEIETLLK